MKESVLSEFVFLVYSVAAGIGCFAGYDLLTVLRIFVVRHVVIEKILDVLYWFAASFFVFYGIFVYNDGIIRGYFVVGMLVGMVGYRMLVGERITNRIIKRKKAILFRRKEKKLSKQMCRKEKKLSKQMRRKEVQIERKRKKELQIRKKQGKINREGQQ